ncbi:MAG: peptide ABC transporter permease [Methanobacteriota archaeon]|nr:MAG: peptide ABC transporter permease [Euryarchaeota archaeon]
MYRYILKRLVHTLPVLAGISIIIFIIIQLTPGDPATLKLGERATPEQIAKLREEMGLNDPLHIQYLRYVKNILKGDLGRSYRNNEKIAREIMRRFPATLELSMVAMFFAILGGVAAGTLAAVKHNSVLDNLSMLAALFGVSMPVFWLGLMLLLVFSVKLGLLPLTGRIDENIALDHVTGLYLVDSIITLNPTAFRSAFSHILLPALALGTIPMAVIARMTRSSMLEVLRQDYVRTAKAKGLPERIVIYKHALRNALIPVVTVIGLNFGLLLGGAILTETIFSWPGIGRYIFLSIGNRDYPAVQGTVLFVGVIFVLVNLLVDISYTLLDPRIKYQ